MGARLSQLLTRYGGEFAAAAFPLAFLLVGICAVIARFTPSFPG
jgi:hypothetical protein